MITKQYTPLVYFYLFILYSYQRNDCLTQSFKHLFINSLVRILHIIINIGHF